MYIYTHLNNEVILVTGRSAVEAEGGAVAVEAIHVAFTARGVSVCAADGEERRR